MPDEQMGSKQKDPEHNRDDQIVVAGAGGFIGGHLIAHLRSRGHTRIRAVDLKPRNEWHQVFADVDNMVADLRREQDCLEVCAGATHIYNLAADMGGMGFIEQNRALCMLSVLINTHLLMAARAVGARRYFYASSACVYNADRQLDPDGPALKESDAYPALPEDGYGWEKLFSERMCRHFREDFGVQTRVARLHNVYGPHGTWDGGREKAPAAICRKVIEAAETGAGNIEIWGNGEQARSFMYIDDCIEGIERLMASDTGEPTNLGSAQRVTINQLVDIVENIVGIRLERRYRLDAPQGVNGRSSDNTLILERLGWAPSVPLKTGMTQTCHWIRERYVERQSKI